MRKGFTARLSDVALILAMLAMGGCAATGAQSGAPTATAQADKSIVFQDPLTSDATGWDIGSNCFFEADGLHLSSGTLCFAPTQAVGDATISVQVRQVSGARDGDYGLFFRAASSDTFYTFTMTSNGSWIFDTIVGGKSQGATKKTNDHALKSGLNVANTLEIRSSGSQIGLFINGTQVRQMSDSTFTAGVSGIISFLNAPSDVVYRNFTIAVPAHGGAPQPPASPTATPSKSTVVFQDPLTSNKNNWPTGGGCAFQRDGYHLTAGVGCAAPTEPPEDADISVKARQIKGDTETFYGLAVRASNSGFYAFQIDGDGVWIFEKQTPNQGTFIVPFSRSSAIHTGLKATNTLEIRVAGSHFDFYVNGRNVGRADDPSLSQGSAVLLGADKAEVVYTTFQVAN